ncbi:bifunctional 4-hydroxy-2-oxoglutarate aldolase/2-dehydro-3-deoxy-phosphogluconate aldolase [Puia dinghuensis]|uniref:2-keto-3-deoxy-phosphogluconate aldolase n=1 Tax=Puia dinghuensis TaxID=1792502 RepID=A0A8J2XSU0_9BACT|nr:bifunctional 4-hydroxy-2-oxoglutarate aldolase/2-dehydro-3-deoxy-phosphogluconate aldolase [Puia dinghuensis]GGA98607.1 2-keto-3-deoxy-phosphogluconate aldolase [Puia dinghuensis]
MTTLQQIIDHRVVAILRGCDPDHILPIAQALYDGGIRLLEITLNSRDALKAIEETSAKFSDKLLIGAGTVLSPGEAEAAIAAGARFILSPSLDLPTIERTLELGAVSIPGAFTATEILTAYRNGAGMVKVFPASVGPAYFRDLRGPFPHIPLMPTGGVNLGNIRQFQKARAAAFGIGSALVTPTDHLTPSYLQDLTTTAAAYVEAVGQ